MNRITEAHIFVWRATPAIQCALRLFDSFNSETTKIKYQFLNEKFYMANLRNMFQKKKKGAYFTIFDDNYVIILLISS